MIVAKQWMVDGAIASIAVRWFSHDPILFRLIHNHCQLLHESFSVAHFIFALIFNIALSTMEALGNLSQTGAEMRCTAGIQYLLLIALSWQDLPMVMGTEWGIGIWWCGRSLDVLDVVIRRLSHSQYRWELRWMSRRVQYLCYEMNNTYTHSHNGTVHAFIFLHQM